MPVAATLKWTDTYSHIQRCVALRVLDVGRGTLLQKQLDEAEVALGRRSVKGRGLILVFDVGVCSFLQQLQSDL